MLSVTNAEPVVRISTFKSGQYIVLDREPREKLAEARSG
jgi:hypothetical protein